MKNSAKNPKKPTDEVISQHSGFDINDIQGVMKDYTETGEINWSEYYKDKQADWDKPTNSWKKVRYSPQTGGDAYDTQYMLERFYDESSALHESGYYLPENLDTNEIENLINGDSSNGD